jgi:hypothetical protein
VDRRLVEREQDIEELRRVALAQHTQIELLVAALARKCKELESVKGSEGELQQTLALVDQLTRSVETAKLHAVDPAQYLRGAVIAADRGELLLPWRHIAR